MEHLIWLSMDSYIETLMGGKHLYTFWKFCDSFTAQQTLLLLSNLSWLSSGIGSAVSHLVEFKLLFEINLCASYGMCSFENKHVFLLIHQCCNLLVVEVLQSMWHLYYTVLQHVCGWMIVKFIFSSPLENLCLHTANGLNSTPLVNISVSFLSGIHRLPHNHASAVWYMGNS